MPYTASQDMVKRLSTVDPENPIAWTGLTLRPYVKSTRR